MTSNATAACIAFLGCALSGVIVTVVTIYLPNDLTDALTAALFITGGSMFAAIWIANNE
jgi:hypothetical protein